MGEEPPIFKYRRISTQRPAPENDEKVKIPAKEKEALCPSFSVLSSGETNAEPRIDKGTPVDKEFGQRREGRSLGRYPFLAATNHYLEVVKGLYAKATVDELDRKYRKMAEDFGSLKERGLIETDNPYKMREKDLSAYLGLLRARMGESGEVHN
jgi:hypothetical protein